MPWGFVEIAENYRNIPVALMVGDEKTQGRPSRFFEAVNLYGDSREAEHCGPSF